MNSFNKQLNLEYSHSKMFATLQENNKHANLILFLGICSIYMLLQLFADHFIFTEQLYYQSLSDQLTRSSIDYIFSVQEKLWWLNYSFIPVKFLLKSVLVCICICIGLLLANITFQFKSIFEVVLKSEIIFVIAQGLFFLNLYLQVTTVTFESAPNYFPLSVLSFIGIENIHSQWAVYPLQTANLFELFYIITLSWLLSKKLKPDLIESLNIVIPTYGLGLILWVVLVAFLALQIS